MPCFYIFIYFCGLKLKYTCTVEKISSNILFKVQINFREEENRINSIFMKGQEDEMGDKVRRGYGTASGGTETRARPNHDKEEQWAEIKLN